MKTLLPPGWPLAKGYSHGVMARGQMVFVAGQVPTLAAHPELDYRTIRSVGGVLKAGTDWRVLTETA